MKITMLTIVATGFGLAACSETPSNRPLSDAALADQVIREDAGPKKDGPQPDAPKPDGPATKQDTGPRPKNQYFPASAIWYKPIDTAPLHARSSQMISALQSAGGWGHGNRFRIDFSLVILDADNSTPMRSFTRNPAEHWLPDCDTDDVPVPPGGALEGENDYSCDRDPDGDCHLIVAHWGTMKLYEMWRAHIDGSNFRGGCLAVWDMTKDYGLDGRGKDCTSADAAGYPMGADLLSREKGP